MFTLYEKVRLHHKRWEPVPFTHSTSPASILAGAQVLVKSGKALKGGN